MADNINEKIFNFKEMCDNWKIFEKMLNDLEKVEYIKTLDREILIKMLDNHLLHDVYYDIYINELKYNIDFFDFCLQVCKQNNINIDKYYEETGLTKRKNWERVTLLHRIADSGRTEHFDIFKKLIEYGADINMFEEGFEGFNTLHFMVYKDYSDEHIEMVGYIIDQIIKSGESIDQVPINTRNERDVPTPLYYAVLKGQVQTSKLLIDYGADKNNMPDQYETSLSVEEYNEIVKYEPITNIKPAKN